MSAPLLRLASTTSSPEAAPADDPVAHGERLPVGPDTPSKNSEIDRARPPGDAFGEAVVFRRINLAQAAAEHRHGPALGGERPLVRGGVDAAGEATEHRQPRARRVAEDSFRAVSTP